MTHWYFFADITCWKFTLFNSYLWNLEIFYVFFTLEQWFFLWQIFVILPKTLGPSNMVQRIFGKCPIKFTAFLATNLWIRHFLKELVGTLCGMHRCVKKHQNEIQRFPIFSHVEVRDPPPPSPSSSIHPRYLTPLHFFIHFSSIHSST
jgi:hypothetical protein